MYDWPARVTNFLIRLVPAAVLTGVVLAVLAAVVMAVLVLALLLLQYAAHLI